VTQVCFLTTFSCDSPTTSMDRKRNLQIEYHYTRSNNFNRSLWTKEICEVTCTTRAK
jgi:hypothetical protein